MSASVYHMYPRGPWPVNPEGEKPVTFSFGEDEKAKTPEKKVSFSLPLAVAAVAAIYFLV